MNHYVFQITFVIALSFLTIACGEKPLTSTLNEKLEKANSDLVAANKKQIETALSLYRLDKFAFPSTEEGLKELIGKDYLLEATVIESFRYERKDDGSYVLESL